MLTIAYISSTQKTAHDDAQQKQRDELHQLSQRHFEDQKKSESDYQHRLDKLRLDIERYKQESFAQRDQMRTAQMETSSERRKREEAGKAICTKKSDILYGLTIFEP